VRCMRMKKSHRVALA